MTKSAFLNRLSASSSGFSFSAAFNKLSGAIEEDLFEGFAGLYRFTFDLSYNEISALPSSLFGNSTFPNLALAFIYLQNNIISSPVPDYSLYTNWTPGKSFLMDLSNNRINHILPDALCKDPDLAAHPAIFSSYQLTLSENEIFGTLPSALLDDCGLTILYMSRNQITGSLPPNWIYNVSAPRAIDLSFNQLTAFTDGFYSNSSQTVNLDLSCNNISTIPTDESLGSIVWTRLNLTGNVDIGKTRILENGESYTRMVPQGIAFKNAGIMIFSNCSFAGPLPEFVDGQGTLHCPTLLQLTANLFEGPIPSSWSRCTIPTAGFTKITFALYVDQNQGVFGPIPDFWKYDYRPTAVEFSLFQVVSFIFDNTSLSGIMPKVSYINETSNMQSWVMSGTHTAVDMCASPVTPPTSPRPTFNLPTSNFFLNCNLNFTNACSCPELWPHCDTQLCGDVTVFCDPRTRPSPDFYCFNKSWTSIGPIVTPTVVVQSGSTVRIFGNLTADQIILGAGGSVFVDGCANVSEIVLDLDASKLQRGKTNSTLITSQNKCGNLQLTAIKTRGNTGCKEVKVTRANTSTSSLAVLFSVDTTSCNLWWIILVSILGLLAISGLIIALIILSQRKARQSPKLKLNG